MQGNSRDFKGFHGFSLLVQSFQDIQVNLGKFMGVLGISRDFKGFWGHLKAF